MCQEFCSQGGCLPQCMLGCPPPGKQTPQKQTFPLEQTPSSADTHTPEQTPPGSRHPQEQTFPLEADTPTPPSLPKPTPPGSRHPPGSRQPPQGQTHPPHEACWEIRAGSKHPIGMQSCTRGEKRGMRTKDKTTMAIYKNLFAGISDLFATLNILILSGQNVIEGYCLCVKIF